MTVHELKILPEYYKDILDGVKSFEIRKADRDYKVGDILVLQEWTGESFTGGFVRVRVTSILQNHPELGLMDGYVILGIRHLTVAELLEV